MVVDDDESMLSLLDLSLQGAGHVVFTACCWEEALEILGEETIEVVLLDVQLGDMDGDVVAGLLRKFTNLKAPILFHSSQPEEELAGMVERTGVKGYVRKGGTLSALLDRLDRAMEEGQSPR
jgi:DNA-binding response OmpR family regulator